MYTIPRIRKINRVQREQLITFLYTEVPDSLFPVSIGCSWHQSHDS